MTTLEAPEFFVQTKDGTLHAYWDPMILRIDLRLRPKEDVCIFSRHHGLSTTTYTEVRCLECFDHDEKCQECCEHDEHDHGICLWCEKDCTDDLVGVAEALFEGDR